MIGSIAGDVIGSVYEGGNSMNSSFVLFDDDCRFTDDTVLSVAVADWIMHGGSLAAKFHDFYHRYPHAGYGGRFIHWAFHRHVTPYNSLGNGSAMRVGPVGFAFDSLKETLKKAEETAIVTHNHPEGIHGAKAVAAAIFLARTGKTKEDIREYLTESFGYKLTESYEDLHRKADFSVTCEATVPRALIAFLAADNFEGAVRNAVSLGGDTDTVACMAGGIAEAYYKNIPEEITDAVIDVLDDFLMETVIEFYERFMEVPLIIKGI